MSTWGYYIILSTFNMLEISMVKARGFFSWKRIFVDRRCERDSERDLESSFLEKFPKPRQISLLPVAPFVG